MNWDRICRTCLSTDCSLESVFNSPDPLAFEYEYSASYSDMIKSVASVSIKPGDKLPLEICSKCIQNILIAFNFQKLIDKTENILQSIQSPVNEVVQDTKNNINKDEEIIKKNNRQNSTLKTRKIKVKDVKTLKAQNTAPKIKTIQFDNNSLPNTRKRALSPPPLVFLSKSKETPPPLVFLPKKINIDLEKEYKFVCTYCKMKYPTEHDLNRHISIVHNISIDYGVINHKKLKNVTVCHLCGKTPNDLLLHLGEHYKFLHCTTCDLKFNGIQKYESHMKKHLKSSKSTTIKLGAVFNYCKKCNISFANALHLELHKIDHSVLNFNKCRICKVLFKQTDFEKYSDLCFPCKSERSIDLWLTTENPLCYICGIESDNSENTCNLCKSDMKTLRLKNRKQFVCSFCGKEFTNSALLVIHERNHN